MKIYHGSNEIVEKPLLEKGKLNNDFGQGFYCTKDLDKAKQWACRDSNNGIVNKYELNIDKLKVLDLTSSNYNVLNWIAILLKNRQFDVSNIAVTVKDYLIKNFTIDTKAYDVVIGYRADDSYFSFARSFVSNSLSINNLEKALKLGNLGKQIVLVSNKAFKNIRYIESYVISDSKYHNEFISNDVKARKELEKISDDFSNGIYAVDILRMKLKNNDERLPDILSR